MLPPGLRAGFNPTHNLSIRHAIDCDAAIVKAVITLGHSLGLEIIGEGVETLEQARQLRTLRCNCMQGYLVSRPFPA